MRHLRIIRSTLLLALVAGATLPLLAQSPTVLKLATFAPANTTWYKALVDMGTEVQTKTARRVSLTVFANGTQGPEATVVNLMRVGNLSAALLMPGGLSQIDSSAGVFGLPFFLQSDAELDHVLSKVGPEVAKRLEAKGFHLLNWGSAGWIQIFSKNEIRTLADLKKAKLFTSSGDDTMVRWYRENGFNTQALSEKEIVPQLRLPNGMIDAVPSPPYGAVALQFFSATPYVLDMKIAPLVGATVVTTAAWNKLSAEDKATLTAAAQTMQKRVMTEVPNNDAASMAAMKLRVKVVTLDAAARTEFSNAAAKLVPTLRDRVVPADIYDLAVRERDAFRKTQGR